MDIRVSGHQMETGAALQEHATDRLGGIVDKYFDGAISSHVTFGKAPAGAFHCDIVTHVMQGLILRSQAEAQDAQAFVAGDLRHGFGRISGEQWGGEVVAELDPDAPQISGECE